MITRKICPECGSEDVRPIGNTDQWMCNECGYSGEKFNEEAVIGRRMDEEGIDDKDETIIKPVKKKTSKKPRIPRKK